MKKRKNSDERTRNGKKKLMSALCMLLISSLLMTGTSYAWLILSTAPEVAGITTNVGANGALEIALLTGETRQDLSKIRTAIGGSLANERVASANTSWGNLIDLTVADYGLNEIFLSPARLQYSAQSDGTYIVNSGLLSVPTYGYDGRIVELTDNTVSAIYADNEFAYNVGIQDYGVRAIGTSDSLSVQASALAMAKGNITSYTKSASSTASSTLNKNGAALFNMMAAQAAGLSSSFGSSDLGTIQAIVTDLEVSLNYIDLALRQGLVAVAAAELGDEDTFVTVRNKIMDTESDLSDILNDLSELSTDAIPEEYATWIAELEETQSELNNANVECASLAARGESYTWDELTVPLNYIMNTHSVLINDEKFGELTESTATGLVGGDVTLTLGSGSGVFADIADFTDDYSAMFTAMYNTNVEAVTLTTVDTPYLLALSVGIKDLEAAGAGEGAVQRAELSATYGYALDMAFRCNATGTSSLLLQTAAAQRIYSDSTAASTMGGGSYMEFSTKDSSFTLEQMIQLMDAVRVAFVDDQGKLLKVAKLNTSNRTTENGVVKAPLYLYDFSFSEEDGSMIMGERQKADNAITSLDQNVAKAVTTLVWLDGDIVDNTMVSAAESASLNGVLNLQFASDADLVPAYIDSLMYATSDKSSLATAIDAAEMLYTAGQSTYTTISWNAFADAYDYAVAINENTSSTEAQIYYAATNLTSTKAALAIVSTDVLSSKIDEIRTFMGTTDVDARVVVKDNKTGTYLALNPYTAEQYDAQIGTIKQVNYNNNLHDEGNDVATPIYSDESWYALAAALYDAEAILMMGNKATDPLMDAAISAMDNAYSNLQRMVFYVPYDYEGSLFYFAITNENDPAIDEDTYGKWYDAQFQRVVSDLTILHLDAKAELADIAEIEQNEYIPYSADKATPFINILSERYPSLSNEEIVAIQWMVDDPFVKAMTSVQKTTLTGLVAEAESLNNDSDAEKQVDSALIKEADNLLDEENEDAEPTAEDASDLISRLQDAIASATPDPDQPKTITAEQIILLSTAIDSAKSVIGFDSEEELEDKEAQAAMDNLRSAVADAQECINDSTTTVEEAAEVLKELNTQLANYGKTEITEANTLPIYVPTSPSRFDIVYAVESEGATFYLTHEVVDATISAVVLTKNGVIFTAEKEVSIYYPADGIEITSNVTDLEIGQSTTAGISFVSNTISGNKNDQGVYEDENGIPVPEAYEVYDKTSDSITVHLPAQEDIDTCLWASNSNVLKISGEKSSTCTITAVGIGTATLSVLVETEQGNEYVASITINVVESASEGNEG